MYTNPTPTIKNEVHTYESIRKMCAQSVRLKNIFFNHKFTLDEIKQILTYDTNAELDPEFIKLFQPHLDIIDIEKIF